MNGIEKILDGKAIDDTQKDEIISCIKGYIIECFRVETNIELINSCNIKLLNSSIVKILKSVNTYEDWLSSKAHLYDIIVNKHGK